MSAAHSAETSPKRLAPVPAENRYAPCDQCGAPLDDQQRYCVHCGRRRVDGEEPALAWVASRRAPAVARTTPAPPPRNPLAMPAIVLALLPVVAGMGVMAGHRGGTDQRLLDALRNQRAPVVRVAGVDAAAASAVASQPARAKDSKNGKVIAHTAYGDVHKVAGYKPTAAKVQADRQVVKRLGTAVGKNYLQSQRNLPDTIVVTKGAGGSGGAPQGRGD
jgi:hypothetical protein